MKKFILKTFIFLGILTSILGVIYSYLYLKEKPKIKLSKKNIIIGDSNTRWSIDDKILSTYANYSTGGETYLFAYTKLKLLSKDNKIDTLLLSFNNHNIINNMWWNDNDGTPLDNRMPAFYQDFSLQEHWDLFSHTPKTYYKSLLKIGKSFNFLDFYKSSSPMERFGSYQPNPENETQHPLVPYEYKKPTIYEIETKYLHKIIEECQNKNIYLILIQPPKNYLRKDYKNYAHKEFYDYYYTHLSNIDFLDFSELPLPAHAYWDMTHTDIVGAEYFTNFLKNNGGGIYNLIKSKYNLRYNKNYD